MNYKELYLLYCSDLNNCTDKNDVKRHNAAMKKLSKLYAELKPVADKSYLLELLQIGDDRTRSLVAAHCLGYGVYLPEAKRVLSKLSKQHRDPYIAFEAKETLAIYMQQGNLHF